MVIEAEIRSQILYGALAKSFRNGETNAVFHELITLEKAHEEKVRAAFSREFPGEKLKQMDNPKLEMPGVNLYDPKEVLEFAISREELANSIYSSMAAQTKDEDIKAMLLQFAEEETEHKALLLLEVQRIHGALQWYDPSELNGMMED
jgi:rubrerythrin